MNPTQKRHAFLGWAAPFVLVGILISGTLLSVAPVWGQSVDTITNIAQMTQALSRANPLTTNLELNGTVCSCDTNTGALILQDSTGAELLEMDSFPEDLKPGDHIQIAAKSGFLSAGDFGVRLAAAPLLDDDGI